jgi:hypothetical protein
LTGGVLVGSHDRRINHDPVEIWLLKPFEDGLPESLLRPVVEAVIHGVIFAEALRQVRPRGPGSSNPNDRVDELAVIFGISARVPGFARKQRFDTLVLFIRNFVASSHRRKEFWTVGAKSHIDADLGTKMPLP